MKNSAAALVASLIAAFLALYETFAIWTDLAPPITEIIEDLPEFVEFLIVGGLMVWLAHHFKWFSDLLKLLGR